MKTKAIVASVLFLGFSIGAIGCDICGGAMNSGFPGLFSQLKTNYFGISYSQNHTWTAHPPDLDDPYKKMESKEEYLTLLLMGQVNLAPRLQGIISMPYKINSRRGLNPKFDAHGIGDVSTSLNYRLLDNSDSVRKVKHFVQIGAGVDIPTGKFKSYDLSDNISPGLQLSSGGANFFASSIYRMRIGNWGWSVNTKYKKFSSNPDKYKIGDNLNTKMMSFYWKSYEKWSSVVEMSYNLDMSMNNSINSEDIEGSERKVHSIGLDFNAFINQIIIGVGAQVPFLQNVEDNKVTLGNLYTTKLIITI